MFIKNLVNYIFFAVLWYGLVRYGNIAIPAVLIYLLVHLAVQVDRSLELKTVIALSSLGIFIDSLLTYCQVFQFQSTQVLPAYWFMSIWLIFTTVFHHSMQFCKQFPWWLNAIIAGFAGPIAYMTGDTISQDFSLGFSTEVSIAVIAIVWAALFPISVSIAKSLADNSTITETSQ